MPASTGKLFSFANGLRCPAESSQLVLEDHSNLAMMLCCLGDALDWPFVPATVNIGWGMTRPSSLSVDPEPTDAELATLRQVDETGALRKQ